jgi:hypothetical protein
MRARAYRKTHDTDPSRSGRAYQKINLRNYPFIIIFFEGCAFKKSSHDIIPLMTGRAYQKLNSRYFPLNVI